MPNPPRPPGDGWSRERHERCTGCGNNRVYRKRVDSAIGNPPATLLTCARCRRTWWRDDA
jgi:DNA-directed RNA polymerase subunit M/transcription elongation factor TFIIS